MSPFVSCTRLSSLSEQRGCRGETCYPSLITAAHLQAQPAFACHLPPWGHDRKAGSGVPQPGVAGGCLEATAAPEQPAITELCTPVTSMCLADPNSVRLPQPP